MTGIVPRVLATVLLLVSLAMFVPVATAALALGRGEDVPGTALAVPLIFLGTGCVLTWLLARKVLAVQLFLTAFALWVVAAGYYFSTLVG